MGDLGNMPAADTELLVRTHCMGHMSQGGNCILIQIRVGAGVKKGGGGGFSHFLLLTQKYIWNIYLPLQHGVCKTSGQFVDI